MTLFENVMKAPFKLTGVHESFVVYRGMMKGFGSTMVDRSTFWDKQQWKWGKECHESTVHIQDGEKKIRGLKMQGKMQFLDLRSMLNGSNVGGLRLI